jgi:nucleoside-diphosphate-sugar epimerase
MAARRPNQRIKIALVTGGLGFIGSALSRRLLAEGARVIVVDNHLFGRRRRALPDHPALTVYRSDIRNGKALTGIFERHKPDAVFHPAAIAFIPACMKDPAMTAGVHLDGTLNVVSAAQAAGARHFHFASSAAVYSPNFVVLSEVKTPALPPPDVYSATRLAGELPEGLALERPLAGPLSARLPWLQDSSDLGHTPLRDPGYRQVSW